MNEPVFWRDDRSPGMESGALTLGILSLFLIVSGFSFILGSIGVTLALLSRGSGKMSGKAKVGFITSLIGIVAGITLTLTAFLALFNGDLDTTLEKINTLYETYLDEGTLNPSDLDSILSEDKNAPAQPSESDPVMTEGNTASIWLELPGEEVLV